MTVRISEKPVVAQDAADKVDPGQSRQVHAGVFNPRQMITALPGAVRKLDPRHLARNPVMFVVFVGSVITTVMAIADPSVFSWVITLWLWFTVIFANLAESVAEGRGKAQAASLRKVKQDTTAHRITMSGAIESVSGTELVVGDRVIVVAGEVIPGDGDVVEGIASVDESAITGESAPVVRESGGDRCAVTGGTTVLSDRIVVEITAAPGSSFVDRMIALVEGASRQKTPNEIALNILLASLTVIFLLAVVAIGPMGLYAGHEQDPIKLIALLVCLIPTTIGALLSAIGIAGMGPPRPAQRSRDVGARGGSCGRHRHPVDGQDRNHHFRQPPGHRTPSGARCIRRRSLLRQHACRALPTELPRDGASSSCAQRSSVSLPSRRWTRNAQSSFRSRHKPG